MDAVLRDGLLLTQILNNLYWPDVYIKFILPISYFAHGTNASSAQHSQNRSRTHPLYGHYEQVGEVLTKRFGTEVYASFTDTMLHVSFTHPSVTAIARLASVDKFRGRCVLRAMNQSVIFEPFPTRVFGDTTLPTYDQTILVNNEEDVDVITDIDHLANLEHLRLRCPHAILWE